MPKSLEPEPFELSPVGRTLAGESIGEGTDVILLHGLTATRRYTVMGSKLLPRAGYRLTTYDARGHGESSQAPHPTAYEYDDLVADLDLVLDHLGSARAVIGGASMGAATALAYALRNPERVTALLQITPAYAGNPSNPETIAFWDALADGLQKGGIAGFLAAYEPSVAGPWRDRVLTVVRQRLALHHHPDAVAQALRVVPRSSAFAGIEAVRDLEAPTLVVASRDQADPQHPMAIAQAYVERIPRARLITEEAGNSPLAWQGARLSQAIAAFLETAL